MGRIDQYPECTTPVDNDLLLIETTEGTKKIKKQNLLKAVMDLLGDDDISEIADGTVTGAITDLNEALNIVQSSYGETHKDNFSAAAQSFTSPIYFSLNKGTYLLIVNGVWSINDNTKLYGAFIRDANNLNLAGDYTIANRTASVSALLTIDNDNTRIYGSVYNEATSAITVSKLSLSYKRLY